MHTLGRMLVVVLVAMAATLAHKAGAELTLATSRPLAPGSPCTAAGATYRRSLSDASDGFPSLPSLNPTGLAKGDLNGDGVADLVATGVGSGVELLLSQGAPGSFVRTEHLGFGLGECPVIGDVTGDGNLDIAVVLNSAGMERIISLFRNTLGTGGDLVVTEIEASVDGVASGSFGAGNPCLAAALGFFDAGTDTDLVVAFANKVLVYTSSSAGTTWDPAPTLEDNSPYTAAHISDVDGDGLLDVVAGTISQEFGVFTGMGGAFNGFLAVAAFGSAPAIGAMVGDYNGDNKIDLVMLFEQNVDSLVAYADVTPGTWLPPVQFHDVSVPTGAIPMYSGESVDFNGDGLDDLVTSFTNEAGNMALFQRTSPATSPAAFTFVGVIQDHSTGCEANFPQPPAFIVDDFDGDGRPDVAVHQRCEESPIWLLSFAPVFTDSVELGHINSPVTTVKSLVVEDFNGDSYLDIVATDTLFIATNDAGVFRPGASFGAPSGILHTVAGDFDNDGDFDLLSSAYGALVIRTNNGAGVFAAPPPSSPLATLATAVPLVASAPGYRFAIGLLDASSPTPCIVTLSDSQFFHRPMTVVHFGPAGLTTYSVLKTSLWGRTVDVTDADGDGVADIVFSNTTFVHVVLNTDATGQFAATTAASPIVLGTTPATEIGAIVFADFDGDGALDYVVACGTQPTDVFVAYGTPASLVFNASRTELLWTPPTDYHEAALAVGDIDGDGDMDVIAASRTGVVELTNNHGVLRPNTGAYIDSGSYNPYDVAMADFSNDGLADVVLVNGNSVDNTASALAVRIQLPLVSNYRQRGAPFATSPNYVRCGATVACLSAAIARVPKCPRAAQIDPPTVPSAPHLGLAPGTISSCRRDNALAISFDLAIGPIGSPGARAIDCSSAGGVLFHVRNGAKVSLSGVDIVGGTRASRDVTGTSVLSVSGTGSELRLSNLAVTACSTVATPATVAQILPGVGGALVVRDGARAVVTDVTATNNQAGLFGGFAAVYGDNSVLEVVDSTVSFNSAVRDGGAFFVDASPDTRLVVTGTTVANNAASLDSGAGGAVALLARPGRADASAAPTVELGSGSTFSANRARWGGVLAAVSEPLSVTANLPPSSADEKRAPSGLGSSLARPPVPPFAIVNATLTANSAAYGGSLYTCGVHGTFGGLTASLSSSAASVAGGFMYSCPRALDDTAGAWSTAAPHSSLPWLRVDSWGSGALAGAEAAGGFAATYGPLAATRVAGVSSAVGAGAGARRVAVRAATEAQSGMIVGTGLTFSAADAFGASVVDPSVLLELVVAPASAGQFVLTGGDPRVFLTTLSTPFPTMAISYASVSAAGAAESEATVVARVVSDPAINGSVTVRVTGCKPGFGRVSAVGAPVVCAECATGTSSAALSLDTCTPDLVCAEGAFVLNGNCVECEPNQVQVAPPDSNTTSVCVCQAGTYTPERLPFTKCVACPSGAVCPGGLLQPRALPGYFDVSDGGVGTGAAFAACRRPGSCAGGDADLCRAGYEGYMCTRCTSGYYSDATRRCLKCPEGAGGLVGFFVVLVVGGAIALAAFLLLSGEKGMAARAGKAGGADNEDEEPVVEVGRTRAVPYSVTMALLFLQILGILGTVQLNWPSSTRDSMAGFNAINADLSVFATQCTITSFASKYALGLAWPLALVVLVLVAALVLKTIGIGKSMSTGRVLESIVFSVGPLAYIPVSRATLILFDCTRLPNGSYRLDADLGEECFDGTWWSLFPLGLIGLVLYVFAVPAYIAFVLYRNRNALYSDADVLARFGGLYKLFRRRFFFMEILLLGKRLAIVVVSLFFSDLQLWLVGGMLIVFFGSALLHVRWDPFYKPLYNAVSIQVDLILSVLLLLGFAFYADRFPSTLAKDVLIVASLVIIVAGMLVLAASLIRELRDKVRGDTGEDVAKNRMWDMLEKDGDDWVDRHQLARLRDAWVYDDECGAADGPDGLALRDVGAVPAIPPPAAGAPPTSSAPALDVSTSYSSSSDSSSSSGATTTSDGDVV